ncbi:MAG: RnfABCDGE type electron transport complex subunit A [Victivallaceae bacterium]|nr:RnfABCDGE type electron transport complex subunit A [Victivallaceae bacterium]
MGEVQQYLQLTIGAVLVYNFVLARFLGICPFLGVSKRLDTALGMSGAVIFVMTLASFVTSLIYNYLLKNPISLGGYSIRLDFLQIILFILVIASLVQLVEIVLQKISPPLYSALGIYLPLITTNCAVMGVATLNAKQDYQVGQATVFGFFSAVGFALALVLFSSLRERLELAQVPKPFQGMAIALITAGILSMTFIGFSGLC